MKFNKGDEVEVITYEYGSLQFGVVGKIYYISIDGWYRIRSDSGYENSYREKDIVLTKISKSKLWTVLK